MAKLIIKFNDAVIDQIDVKPGDMAIGRRPGSDVLLDNLAVSGNHANIFTVAEDSFIQDLESTNGTFINDEPVKNAVLQTGQMIRLGDVEFFVETVEVKIAIPEFERPRPAPPVMLTDGSILCPRHPESLVTHRCPHCHAVLCDACVHRLRRKGGKTLKLCALCSRACVPIGPEKPKKRSFLGLWSKTIKLPFLRHKKES